MRYFVNQARTLASVAADGTVSHYTENGWAPTTLTCRRWPVPAGGRSARLAAFRRAEPVTLRARDVPESVRGGVAREVLGL